MTETAAPTVDDLVSEAVAGFERRFGRPPTLAAQCPGRVNLIGDHVDYCGGLVLPCAIDRHVAIVAAPALGPRSCWRSTTLSDEVVAVHSAVEAPVGRWADRALGVVAALRRRGMPVPELDLLVHASLPAGRGLSSSSALQIAASVLLEATVGIRLEPLTRARICQSAERDFAGVPCGLMDQIAVQRGGAGHALLLDCRSFAVEPIELPARLGLLLIDSGEPRDLAGGGYARRRRECETAARLLAGGDAELAPPDAAATALRDLDERRLDGAALPDPLDRRARHVVSEIARVADAAKALRGDDLARFGLRMRESHASLRDLFEVSTPTLDAIVQSACGLPGVFGARLTGAGFGGSVVVACEADRREEIAEALGARLQAALGARFPIMSVSAGDPAGPAHC